MIRVRLKGVCPFSSHALQHGFNQRITARKTHPDIHAIIAVAKTQATVRICQGEVATPSGMGVAPGSIKPGHALNWLVHARLEQDGLAQYRINFIFP